MYVMFVSWIKSFPRRAIVSTSSVHRLADVPVHWTGRIGSETRPGIRGGRGMLGECRRRNEREVRSQ